MKQRLTRLLAGLTLTALTATGYTLTNEPVATTQQDTGWGAPDTSHTPIADEAGYIGAVIDDTGQVVDTVLGDSGWG